MKRITFVFLLLVITIAAYTQLKPFRFAFLSDTHIGSPDGKAEEDLRRTIADINQMTDIAFVVITGDITELGTNEEIKRAKQIFGALKVPYYIIPATMIPAGVKAAALVSAPYSAAINSVLNTMAFVFLAALLALMYA